MSQDGQQIIVMRRVFGTGKTQLEAGEKIIYTNGRGKPVEGLVVAIPETMIEDSENFVPVVQNLGDAEEDDLPTYVVKIVHLSDINSGHIRQKIS